MSRLAKTSLIDGCLGARDHGYIDEIEVSRERQGVQTRPVYILGAGFSKAISSVMPLTDDLGAEIMPRVLALMVDEVRPLVDESNFESALTTMSAPPPFVSPTGRASLEAGYRSTVELIYEVLGSREAVVLADEMPSWLPVLLAKWHHERAVVVTLNYDTLVERALETVAANPVGLVLESMLPTAWQVIPPIISGIESRTAIRVSLSENDSFDFFKLHGSLDWLVSSSASTPTEVFRNQRASPRWDASTTPVLDPISDRGLRAGLSPCIVPPNWNKSTFLAYEPLVALWTQASQLIREAPAVHLLGYSMPTGDTAVGTMLRQARHSKWVVVDPLASVAEHVRTRLGLEDVTHVGGDDPVAEFVETFAGMPRGMP